MDAASRTVERGSAMRLKYGVVALILWVLFIVWIITNGNLELSDDTRVLSLAIVVAGAMAGGD